MSTQPTHEQAQLHLQVYEMRREAKLRQARDWYFKNYHVESFDDSMRIATPGTENGALAMMVLGYWEQACALLNYGLLHEDLFFETSGEFFGVWERVKPVVPQFRKMFANPQFLAHLEKAAERGIGLQNIRSVAGFERRLNDMTCAGCHQTRGIGGFHFPGVDWMAAKPDNSTVVPASPHFFGDQVRRRDILTTLRDGGHPDYSRGFSSRPQLRGSSELAGTEYGDGWGAQCYVRHADAADDDKSFASWSCAKGLACQPVGGASRIGMCFVK